MKKLTRRQQAILAFIEQYWRENGMSPSFRDIQDSFGFRSPHAVTKHLSALEQKGMLRLHREGGITRARGIIPLLKKRGEVPLVGRIAAVGPADEVEVPEGAALVDVVEVPGRGAGSAPHDRRPARRRRRARHHGQCLHF